MSPLAPVTHSQLMAARKRDSSESFTDHIRQKIHEAERARGSAHARGYDTRWNRARKMFLARHPLCAEHEKRDLRVASILVDHIVPHRGDYRLFWDEDNWQALCGTCHDRKTARERNAYRAEIRKGDRGV